MIRPIAPVLMIAAAVAVAAAIACAGCAASLPERNHDRQAAAEANPAAPPPAPPLTSPVPAGTATRSPSPTPLPLLDQSARTGQPAPTRPAGPIPPAERQRLMDQAFSLIYANQFAQAAPLLERLSNAPATEDSLTAEALFWLGFCEQELGHRPAAQAAYRRLLADYPASRYAQQARRLLADLDRR